MRGRPFPVLLFIIGLVIFNTDRNVVQHPLRHMDRLSWVSVASSIYCFLIISSHSWAPPGQKSLSEPEKPCVTFSSDEHNVYTHVLVIYRQSVCNVTNKWCTWLLFFFNRPSETGKLCFGGDWLKSIHYKPQEFLSFLCWLPACGRKKKLNQPVVYSHSSSSSLFLFQIVFLHPTLSTLFFLSVLRCQAAKVESVVAEGGASRFRWPFIPYNFFNYYLFIFSFFF